MPKSSDAKSSDLKDGRPTRSASARSASAALGLGVVALASVLLGVIGVQLGLLAPMQGFSLFGAGALLGGLSTSLVAAVVLVATRSGNDPASRRLAWIACSIGAGLLVTVVAAGSPGFGLPSINDITTDPASPPAFSSPSGEDENSQRDMSYPAEFGPMVRAAYPDIVPIWLAGGKGNAYRRAKEAAQALGWEITREDPAAGSFEAREVSATFRFVDDIAVRVSARGANSVIDLRSRSRDGRGDLGVNARRIRAFAARFEEAPPVASQ